MILAGDIGGTNTRLAFFGADLSRPELAQTFPSRNHSGLVEIVRAFRAEREVKITAACFGIAGPVRDGRCEATNLPWVVDQAEIVPCLGISGVWLINDLEANAYGLESLGLGDLHTLNEGSARAAGNFCVVSAGTGLGEAGVYWNGAHHLPFATEGGHAGFGPSDDLQVELLEWLRQRFGHVSWERVLSGPGLVNVYRFLKDSGRGEEPKWLAEEIAAGDAAGAISRNALAHRSELCVRALDLFVQLYGSEAGNAALTFMATGGVFLGGGIAPRNLDKLKDGTFMRAFVDKGRMRSLLEEIPVRVILNQSTALLGAARCAARRGGGA